MSGAPHEDRFLDVLQFVTGNEIAQETSKPPLAIIVADRVYAELFGAIPSLDRAEWPGVWATSNTGSGHYDQGGLLVIDTSTVSVGHGFSFWSWLGKANGAAEADTRLRALFADPKLPKVEKDRLQDAIMNHRISASPVELETTAQRVRREGREEGERQALLAVAARLIPDALPTLRTLEDLDALRRAVDEALSRKLGS